MLVYLIVTLFITYQYFAIIYPHTNMAERKRLDEKTTISFGVKKNDLRAVWIYSFLLALAMSELIWTMNFWPFGYLTTGTVALILYYVLWDIATCYFMDILTRRRVLTNSAVFSILVFIILLSSKWIPVI
jgi:hypothetical protein